LNCRRPRFRSCRCFTADALNHPGPAFVDLVTDPNALSIPPHITPGQIEGFALAVTRSCPALSDELNGKARGLALLADWQSLAR